MFQGTIPPPLRSIVHEHAASWEGDVWVGCSGNLTIERTLVDLQKRVHSNDVNPYSCALGWHFSGQPLDYRLKPESAEHLDWLEPYLDGGVGTLATLMLGTSWLDWVGRNTTYHQRMVAAYRAQWPRMHAETVEKLSAVSLRLGSFYPGDVRDYLREAVPADAPFASFPPFWAAGYEVMFRGIETHFDWPEPPYENLDEDGKQEIIDLVCDRPNWLLGLHYLDPGLEAYRVGYVQMTPRAVPIWVYASSLRSRRGLPSIVDTGAGRSSIERSRPRMRRGLPSRGADSNSFSVAASAAMGAVLMVWLFSLAEMGKANASGRLYKDDASERAWMTECGLPHRIFH